MTDTVFLFIVAIVFLVLQTISLAALISGPYKPDLMVSLIVWSGMHTPFSAGICCAFGIGLLVDIFSGGQLGLFAITYTIIFVLTASVHEYLEIDTWPGRFLCVGAATLLSGAIVGGIRMVADPAPWEIQPMIWFIGKALTTSLAALAVFPFLDRGWATYCRLVGVHRDSGPE